jgi:copper chaperone CopZ
MLLTNLGVEAYLFNGSWDAWAYALDPANNHPHRELALQFTEAQPASQLPAAPPPTTPTTPTAAMITTVLIIPSVHCARCSLPVIAAVEALSGVVSIETDYEVRSISIVHYPHLSEAEIRNAIIAAGITIP